MSIRGITAVVACVATIALASDAAAQDTMRTRDSMQMLRQQRPIATMSAQARDSMIARLLDSANRTQDPMIAQRLRDSVTTLRSVAVSSDSMTNRMTDRMSNQMTTQQQTPRQTDSMQQRQPTPATSDQRVRLQKDGRPYPDGTSPASPPDTSDTR
jgi:hypothetical protein